MIKVKVEQPLYGGLILTPVNWRVRSEFDAYMEQFGMDGDHAYVQNRDAEDFLGTLSPRARRTIRNGFDAIVLMDPWEYGKVLGYNACHVEV